LVRRQIVVNWLVALFLILHVGGAIIGFGPTFVFPFIGAAAGKEPIHTNFALRLGETIATRLILPLALFQAVTGVGLIWTVGIDVFTHLWLLAGIVIYVVAMIIVFTNQLPVGAKLVEATKNAPPPSAPGETRPSGPPPHIAALVRRNQLGGMALSILLLVIIILMVGGANGFLP
jgi:Predicted integral membrane protein (DUF2269)